MDALDRLADAAAPLLARVDEIVEHAGAPGHHPVWTELRRVRLLPGDAVAAVTALRPDTVAASIPSLRTARETLAEVALDLPGPGPWDGPAADAYDDHRHRLADHVDDLSARAAATADLGDALASWMRTARDDVATTLADILSTATMPTAATVPAELLPPADVDAAAELATRVLRTVGDAFDAAEPLLDRTAHLADAP